MFKNKILQNSIVVFSKIDVVTINFSYLISERSVTPTELKKENQNQNEK